MNNLKTLAFALLALGPATAAASLIEFQYTFGSGAVLAGEVDGTIQSDGDTILVNALNNVSLNNVAFNPIDPSDICSGSDFPRCMRSPTLSFSGAVMDIFVCSLGFRRGNCSFARDGGFYISTAGRYRFARAGAPGAGFVTDYRYSPGNWSAAPVSSVAVPEPGTLFLLALGMLGIAVFSRTPHVAMAHAG